jgi:hypothetical protein
MGVIFDSLQLLLIAFALAGAISGVLSVPYLTFCWIRAMTWRAKMTEQPPSTHPSFEPFEYLFLDFRD